MAGRARKKAAKRPKTAKKKTPRAKGPSARKRAAKEKTTRRQPPRLGEEARIALRREQVLLATPEADRSTAPTGVVAHLAGPGLRVSVHRAQKPNIRLGRPRRIIMATRIGRRRRARGGRPVSSRRLSDVGVPCVRCVPSVNLLRLLRHDIADRLALPEPGAAPRTPPGTRKSCGAFSVAPSC